MQQTASRLRVVSTIADARAARSALAAPLGFVPTMGALHAGHEALARRARGQCASVIASIFVNPLQFGPGEDLERYPRAFDADLSLLERCGVDLVFAPSIEDMFGGGLELSVDPGGVARHLEGERRPGHFRGVATVVLKLFNILAPDLAYFGRKDAQQLAVVRRLVRDFDLPVTIVPCSTVREADGLALSSRNAHLDAAQRAAAPNLHRALAFIANQCGGRAGESGGRAGSSVDAILRAARAMLAPLRPDYLAVVDPATFEPLTSLPESGALLAVGAAYAGATRLIDNVDVRGQNP